MCSDNFRQFLFDLLTDFSINLGHEICDNAFYCIHVSFCRREGFVLRSVPFWS